MFVEISLHISKRLARRIFRILLLVAVVLCLASLAQNSYLRLLAQDVPQVGLVSNLGDGIQLLDVNEEHNIPTWFSSALLLLCSALLAAISFASERTSDRRAWSVLSIVFALLSFDEIISIHERFIEPIRSLLHTGGLLYFAWVIPGAGFVAVFVLFYTSFLFNLPTKFRYLFIAAGALFVSGSIGMEMLQGLQFSLHGEGNLLYMVQITVEEFLEMTGIILFLYALMRYTSHLQKVEESDNFARLTEDCLKEAH